MGAEGLNFDSPAQQPLAGTHIAYEVDRRVRGWDKPSDHTPVRVDLR